MTRALLRAISTGRRLRVSMAHLHPNLVFPRPRGESTRRPQCSSIAVQRSPGEGQSMNDRAGRYATRGRRPLRFALALMALCGLCALGPLGRPAAAQTSVDLQLALMVDASGSVNQYRFELQKRGYVAALRNPRVLGAILGGRTQSIAISMVQWTGPFLQVVV